MRPWQIRLSSGHEIADASHRVLYHPQLLVDLGDRVPLELGPELGRISIEIIEIHPPWDARHGARLSHRILLEQLVRRSPLAES